MENNYDDLGKDSRLTKCICGRDPYYILEDNATFVYCPHCGIRTISNSNHEITISRWNGYIKAAKEYTEPEMPEPDKGLQMNDPEYWFNVCGEGWNDIIRDTAIRLNQYMIKINHQITIGLVKEKFGKINIFLDYNDDTTDNIVHNAEVASSKTCEYCGKPGIIINNDGWLMARCPECIEKLLKGL